MDRKERRATDPEIGVEQDYQKHFIPSVHKIGFFTQLVAIILTLLPVAYFMFVKGYMFSSFAPYLAFIAVCYPMSMGMYISEPLSYWPMIGSAGIYMSYLSGNASTMRMPVAVSVQNALDAPVDTPKGQIVTIISIAISIVANILVMLLIVICGDWLLNLMPPVVQAAFGFVSICVFGILLAMRLTANREGRILSGLQQYWPHILAGGVMYQLWSTTKLPAAYGPLVVMALCLIISYAQHRMERAGTASEDPQS